MMKKANVTLKYLALVTPLWLMACTPIVATHGNMLSDADIAQIQPTTSTRADVTAKWGPPSSSSSFDPNTWYYIGQTLSHKGVFDTKVDKSEIIKVTFNADDTVASVTVVDPALAHNVDIEDRKTPTAGKEFTAVQQIIGNIGKFNAPATNK